MREIIRLGLMLALICGISAAGLTAVHGTTLPLIEAQRIATLNASMAVVVPGADSFEEVEMNGRNHWVVKSAQGAVIGAITVVQANGYGSTPLEMMVGVNAEGEILNVVILSLSETPGIGTKVNTDGFLGQFIKQNIKEDLEADAITGATISAEAVIHGVKQAAEVLQFDFLQGGQGISKFEAAMALSVPGTDNFEEVEVDGRIHWVAKGGLDGIIGAVTLVEASGYGPTPLEIMVGVNVAGEILNVVIVTHSETPGIGTKVDTDDFLGQFIAQTIKKDLEADGISGATITAEAVIQGVRKAAEVLQSDFLNRQ